MVAVATFLILASTSMMASASAAADSLAFTTSPTPTLNGAVVVGNYVGVTAGTWTPTPDTLSVQWNANGAPIQGARGRYYEPVAADVGAQLTVSVTGVKSGYTTTTVTSAPATVLGLINPVSDSIQGLPKPGDTVTAQSTWDTPDIAIAYQWSDDNGPIDGATSQTYVPTEDEAGEQLAVTITASRDGYQDSSVEPSVTVTHDTIQTSQMYVIGEGRVGLTFSASSDYGWNPVPTTLRYQWLRDGNDIDGATDPTYTATSADVGHVITYRVTGSHAEFPDASTVSQPSQSVLLSFDSVSTPAISGVPEVGVPLTATTAPWSPAPATYLYTWFVNGAESDSQGNDSTFTPTVGDVGAVITVQVYASTSTRGLTQSPISAPSQPVVANPFQLGKATLGKVDLNRAVRVSFTKPPAGIAVTYQWLINNNVVPGATSSTYTPEGSDWHKSLRARLTVSGTGYATSSVTTNSELVHSGHIDPGSAQIIPGEEARIGATLHAEAIGWGPAGVKVHFEWFDFSKTPDLVSTSSTYTIKSDEFKDKLYLFAWGSGTHLGSTRSGGEYGNDYTIERGNFSQAPHPTITGTAKVGSQLAAHHGTWSPSSGVTWHYQWYRQAPGSTSATSISGATHSSYTVTSASVGDQITVRVTASKHHYTTTSSTSSATAVVS